MTEVRQTEIFDGRAEARRRLERLREVVAARKQPPVIVSFFVREDPGSCLYTRKKTESAAAVGIRFVGEEFSFGDPLESVLARLRQDLVAYPTAGVMIQKPTKRHYQEFCARAGRGESLDFALWWQRLIEILPPQRDIDGLSPVNQQKLREGLPMPCLPATVRAVLASLENLDYRDSRILIIGRSDLLGIPLAAYWRVLGCDVTLVGRVRLEQLLTSQQALRDFGLIVSATGQPGLIRGELVGDGVILVDVGEPKGDIDQQSVLGKASFLTPVPGGIGPLTIVSLLENSLTLS